MRGAAASVTERLGDAGIQHFLASKAVVVLATVQADGSPRDRLR